MSKINNLREHMVRLNSALKKKIAGENLLFNWYLFLNNDLLISYFRKFSAKLF